MKTEKIQEKNNAKTADEMHNKSEIDKEIGKEKNTQTEEHKESSFVSEKASEKVPHQDNVVEGEVVGEELPEDPDDTLEQLKGGMDEILVESGLTKKQLISWGVGIVVFVIIFMYLDHTLVMCF